MNDVRIRPGQLLEAGDRVVAVAGVAVDSRARGPCVTGIQIMGYAYTPGLTVAERTTARRIRRLPQPGR